jgi:hypothetical protein
MRDDQRRQRLADANPWWRAVAGGQNPTAWTGHHPVLKGRAAHDLGFRAGGHHRNTWAVPAPLLTLLLQ